MRNSFRFKRLLAGATIGCLFLSTVVPIWAALAAGEAPLSAKIIDGGLAAILVVLLIILHQLASRAVTTEDKAKSFEICRWLAVLPLILFVLYALGSRLKWDVLLIGLGWRGWYLVTIVPLMFAAQRPSQQG